MQGAEVLIVAALILGAAFYQRYRRHQLLALEWGPSRNYLIFRRKVKAYLARHGWTVKERNGTTDFDFCVIKDGYSAYVSCFPGGADVRPTKFKDMNYLRSIHAGRSPAVCVMADEITLEQTEAATRNHIVAIHYRSLAVMTQNDVATLRRHALNWDALI